MDNFYLKMNMDNFIKVSEILKKHYARFSQELAHAAFLIAHDEKHLPRAMFLNGKKYAFIFTDSKEYEKAFGEDEQYMKFDIPTLKDIARDFKLEGLILNVSSQNMYLTRRMLDALDDIPSKWDSSESYFSEELKLMKENADNEMLETFIRNDGNADEIFEVIAESVLFALQVSEKDMSVLDKGGILNTFGIDRKYELYDDDGYVPVFTRSDGAASVETSKFKYLSIVNFPSVVHYAIQKEFKGIIINPQSDRYVIPVETLLVKWGLIYETCNDAKLASSNHVLFSIGDENHD